MLRVIFIILGVMAIGLFAIGGHSYTSVHAVDPALVDSDDDNCPDAIELGSNPSFGGQRDPNNPWDFFDPITPFGVVTIPDIVAVVQAFGTDAGYPGYSEILDRTWIGPNRWNLGPGDGHIRGGDISSAVKQFGYSCQQPSVDSASFCNLNLQEANGVGINNYQCSQAADFGVISGASLPGVGGATADEVGEIAGTSNKWKFWQWDEVQNGRAKGHWVDILVTTKDQGLYLPTDQQLTQLAGEIGIGEVAAYTCFLGCPVREVVRSQTCRIEMKQEVDPWGPGAFRFEYIWLEVTWRYYRPWGAILVDSIVIHRGADADWGHNYDSLNSNWQWKDRGWPNLVTTHVEARFYLDALQPSGLHLRTHLNQLEWEIDGFGYCWPWWDGDYTEVNF